MKHVESLLLAWLWLCCVNLLVPSEVRLPAEGFPTFTALIRPFSCMDSLVLDECVFAVEGLPTFAAPVMHMSTVRGLPTLSTPCLLLAMGGLLLVTAQTGLEVLLLLTWKRLF